MLKLVLISFALFLAFAAHSANAQGCMDSAAPLWNLTFPHDYVQKRSSSYDRSGGNADARPIAPGETLTVLDDAGPGVLTHIWFTIASHEQLHLKRLVLRIYWDGESTPSVESPVGDFFGLGLGEYFLYQSIPLSVGADKALNSFFVMPFQSHARITVSNEGAQKVDAFYFNIDYRACAKPLPAGTLYFHAQYRQAAPAKGWTNDWKENGDPKVNDRPNLTGEDNYIWMEAKGRGQFAGVTMSVLQNQDFWWGEGDDMFFVDADQRRSSIAADERRSSLDANQSHSSTDADQRRSSSSGDARPSINGTGSEDYFLGAWGFGTHSFAYGLYGAPVKGDEKAGSRSSVYRFHLDSPITFTKSFKATIEHGHANHRSDNFYSVAYWYQTEPHAPFPALPAVADRLPQVRATGSPGIILK